MEINFALYETVLGYFKICYSEGLVVKIEKEEFKKCSEWGSKSDISDLACTQLNDFFFRKTKGIRLSIRP